MSQPLCTVLQISLVELLRHLGIVAEAVVGHSSGEIAAAYTVGALSLRDACLVAYYRGLLAQELVAADSQPGAMISVNLAEAEVDAYLEKACLTGIAVACINSPFNVTLSGDSDVVDAAMRHLEKDGIFCRRLNTGVAYHSPAMRAISSDYLELLSSMTSGSSSPAAALMASSVTGQKTTNMALSQGQYWVDNLVSPVQFSDAIRYLALAAPKGDGLKPISDYVEIGPQAVLKRPVTDTLRDAIKDKTFGYFSALSKFESPIKAILELVGQLCIRGHSVSVVAANQQLQKSSFLVDAPGYPFDHSQSYWHESRISRNWRLRPPVSRDLLGIPAMDWNDTEPRWRKFLRISEMPWLEDHVIGEDTLFPATGSLCMAIEAVRQMSDNKESIVGYRVKHAVFMKPIVVQPDNSTEVITQVRSLQEPYEKADLRFQVQIFAVLNGTWVECSKYEIHIESAESQNEVSRNQNALLALGSQVQIYPDTKGSATEPIDTGDFYHWCRSQGLNYGKTFSIAEGVCWNGEQVAVARIPAPNGLHDGIVHPAVFDAACQICYVGASNGLSRNIPTTVPHRIRDAWLAADGWQHPQTRQLRVATKSKPNPVSTGITGTVHISSDNGLPLAYIHKFDFLPVASQAVNDDFSRNLLQQVEWKSQLSMLSLEQLRSHCVARSSGEHEDDTEHYYLDLENALYSVVSHNLNSLGQIEWNSIAPHMRAYISSLETHLQTLQSDAREIVDEETAVRALQELSMLRPQWEVFYRVAQNLSALAHGQMDTLDLSPLTSLAADFHGSLLSGFKKQLEAFFDLSAHQNSTLRILEVECDSGALTALVISILEEIEARTGGVAFSEYVCTDTSKANLERARERFKHHQGRLEFKFLDLRPGYDAISPELGPEGFDIVLTGGNPCSTRTVSTIMDSLRKAVKPAGHLVLCPHTHPDNFAVNFALGILPGWIRDGTEIPPVVSRNPLETVLPASEVSHEGLTINEHNFKVPRHACLIISRAGAAHPLAHESPKVLLVVAPGISRQRNLGSSALDRFASLGHASHIISLDELAETDLDATDCIVFLADLGKSLLIDIPEHTFKSIKAMVQRAQNVLWVTHADTTTEADAGACSLAGIKDGFLRTLRAEFHNKRIVSLSIEGADTSPLDYSFLISTVFKSAFLDGTMEVEYIARGNQILTGRLVHDSQLSDELSSSLRPTTNFSSWLPGPPLMLDIGSRGHLDTLYYVEDTDHSLALGANDVEIEAKAWALNFRDVFGALGRLDDAGFGTDCAGIVTRVGPDCQDIQPGDRVCMGSVGCMRMYPRGHERAVVKLDSSTPFEEACALITPGMTAWHSLATVARVQEGEKVLIHAASGATGQLAIQVAQALKAEIFVTVGYGYKKQLLIDQYGISEDHIFYSRSSNNTFAKDVMRMTNGYGVDVVLNSLVGEGLRASWECIAPYGRFIEIGKTDINANSKLPMGHFEKNVTFSAVDIRHIFLTRVQSAGSLLHHVMRMSDQGTIRRPEPLHIYSAGDIEDAFRYVQSGKNSGRVVIQLSPETQVPKHLITRRQWEFDRESSYLVVGGFGGIGRAILDWMVSRGAMNLIVLSRSGPNSGDAAQLMHELSRRDVRVLALKTTSVDLGVVRDIGVVAETESLKKRFDSVANGLGQVEATEVMALLDICCDPVGDLVGHPSQVLLGMETPADMLARSLEVPEIMDRPLFQYFSQAQSLHERNAGSLDNFALLFRKVGTVEERNSIVTKSLMNKLARAIAVKPEDIESSKPLHQFGVDSLVAVELRNWIAKNFAADISVFEIMSGRTVKGVAEFVVGNSQVPMAS
ncbi:polyketide synthase [Pestalotiopsis sp. 9143b]|nr:polyketide synthase [Pestalotiopsis sp. 9143b]